MKICEHFKSLQGEGTTMGIPTYFIRTTGCNLSCSWCDTLYAMDNGEEMSIPEIVELIKGEKHICITGGEPLLQEDMLPLIKESLLHGCKIQLETNGSININGVPKSKDIMISMDIKCPSSGMTDRMCISNINMLSEKDQLKFIIADDNDFEFAVQFLKDNPTIANVIFTPVGGMDILPLTEKVLASKIDVRVLPQLHKIIWGDKRSV